MPTSATREEDIVRKALRSAGLAFNGSLSTASSTSNEVFQSGEHIVRINRTGTKRLIREARLCLALPRLEWTPEVIDYGEVDDATYLIIRRKQGTTLARWWPDMRPRQRREAIGQLAGCMRAIHSTAVPDGIGALQNPPQNMGTAENPVLPVLRNTQRLRKIPVVEPALIDDLEAKLKGLAPTLEHYPESRLIHGDLTFQNVLWNGSSISAVLDFEWARGAPRDLDLDVLCRFLTMPGLHLPPATRDTLQPGHFSEVIGWLHHGYPELFSPRNLPERLMTYALAFEIGAVLRNPPNRPADQLPDHHPYRRLIDVFADGGPGARMITSVGTPGRSR